MLVLVALGLASGALSGSPVYVAPGGSDANDGSEQHPLASIGKAIATVRGSADPTVVLGAGVFALNATLRLTAADSGLTLRAKEGERAVVSGGIAVPGWACSAGGGSCAAGGIWVAPLPAAAVGLLSSPRQLYVNGRRANRTSANATILGTMTLPGAKPTQAAAGIDTAAGGSYNVSLAAMQSWSSCAGCATDVEFVYAAQIVPWTEPRCGVKAISADGRQVCTPHPRHSSIPWDVYERLLELQVTMKQCISKLLAKPAAPMRYFMAGLPSSTQGKDLFYNLIHVRLLLIARNPHHKSISRDIF